MLPWNIVYRLLLWCFLSFLEMDRSSPPPKKTALTFCQTYMFQGRRKNMGWVNDHWMRVSKWWQCLIFRWTLPLRANQCGQTWKHFPHVYDQGRICDSIISHAHGSRYSYRCRTEYVQSQSSVLLLEKLLYYICEKAAFKYKGAL